MKEHEKLIAFVFLILAILALVVLASTFDRGASNDIVVQGKLRIIDSSVAGLLAIAGMAAQALFRIAAGEKIPVTVENKRDDPVHTTTDDPTIAPAVGELPEAEKIA
jgi:hypothetical protein